MKKLMTVLFISMIFFGCEIYDDTNCAIKVGGITYKCDTITTDGITNCCHTKEGLVFCTHEDYDDICYAE